VVTGPPKAEMVWLLRLVEVVAFETDAEALEPARLETRQPACADTTSAADVDQHGVVADVGVAGHAADVLERLLLATKALKPHFSK